MAPGPKPRKSAAIVDRFEASSTVIGPAFEMPEASPLALAAADMAPIDFQARQDSISPTRRNPGPTLAPRLKKTAAKPAKAKETKIKL